MDYLKNLSLLGRAFGAKIHDGLENVLTGLGVRGRDSRIGATYRYRKLSFKQLEEFYDTSDIAKIVCDRIPEMAVKKWFEPVIEDGDSDLITKIKYEEDRLCVKEKFLKAMTWARVYGGAVIFVVTNDGGGDLSTPLKLESINQIQNLLVFHKWEVNHTEINTDLADPNFGMPEYFDLSGRYGINTQTQIHHSRFIRFEGVPLSEEGFQLNDYWNDSHLVKLHGVARDYDDAYNGVFNALKSFGMEILKMDNVSAMIAGGKEDLLKGRLRLLQLSKSVMSTIVLDSTNESYEMSKGLLPISVPHWKK